MKKLISILSIFTLLSPLSALALNFDGVNDYVDAGDIGSIDNATQLTISAWVKHNSITTDDVIISKGDSTLASPLILFRDDVGGISGRTDTYKIFINGVSDAFIEGATNASKLGVWTHVVITFIGSSATGLRLYVNGVEDPNSPASTSDTNNIDASANPFRIGINSSAAVPFDGLIDEVRVYNRVLSANEIRMLYRGFPSRSGLVGYWPLIGNTSGTFEPDFSGYGNHGTRTGGPIRAALNPFTRLFRR